jgi:hypothetical protein
MIRNFVTWLVWTATLAADVVRLFVASPPDTVSKAWQADHLRRAGREL